MTDAEREALWVCAVCGTTHCIPDFACDCERSHAEGAQ